MTEFKPEGVYVHPFKIETDRKGLIAETCCDHDDPGLAGWAVYLRLETPEGEIDISDDDSFLDFPAAWHRAEALASDHGVPVSEY